MQGPVAVQGAQGRAARRLRERDKRERVTGAIGRELLPMGLGRADSLRGREAIGDNAQPMGGWAMRGHFQTSSDQQGLLCSRCRRLWSSLHGTVRSWQRSLGCTRSGQPLAGFRCTTDAGGAKDFVQRATTDNLRLRNARRTIQPTCCIDWLNPPVGNLRHLIFRDV